MIVPAVTLRSGVVISVRGSVVDLRFDDGLPPIYTLLRAGGDQQVLIEVQSQLDAQRVRGIALTPTQGLVRGMPVTDSGGPLLAPVARASARACSMYSAMPSTRSPSLPGCNGAPCSSRRPH